MLTKEYFLDKADRCRRLAFGLPNQADPAVAALYALAREFEAEANAIEKANSEERLTAD